MTAYVERASYRAVLRDDASEEALEAAVAAAASDARARVHEGELLTAGLYRYHNQLFLYLEHIYEGQGGGEDGVASRPNLVPKRCALPDFAAIRRAPAVWRWLDGLLVPFPGLRGLEPWAYMCPVFWFDEPTTPESYLRRPAPDERCGRIAVLQPDKLMDYVCHHQAIVREGRLVGDRFQFISIHDDVLFSYFERPRDRGKRNTTGSQWPSSEITRWLAVDPASHFDHFPEANGDDFLVIEPLFSCGR